MKKLFIILFSLFWLSISAQEQKDSTYIFEDYENNVSFQGGFQGLQQYLEENIQWPEGEPKYPKVYVSFLVNEDGTVTDVKIVKGINERFDNEALRVVSEMPKWSPSKYMGKAIKQRCIIPIIFKP